MTNKLKYSKPGRKKKKTKITTKTKIREIEKPENTSCKFCNSEDDGTCCYRHSEDPDIKFLVGGGITGGKIPDQLTVWACDECDREMSTKPYMNHGDDMILHAIRFREWQNKWKLGVIKSWLI